MILHGTIFTDPKGLVPLVVYVRDADNQEELTRAELRVRGNQVLIVPLVPQIANLANPIPRADVDAVAEGHPEIKFT